MQNNKNTKLNISLTPNFSSKMSTELFLKLNRYRETNHRSFVVEQYLLNDVTFASDFNDIMNFDFNNYHKKPRYDANLILLQAHQGTGKTTFLINSLYNEENVVLIIEPKKTNIEQIAKQYPFITTFTSDSIAEATKNNYFLISQFTKVVVCVPELALKAYQTLLNIHKRVDYCIFDEAHDIITSIPAYRESDNLFNMIEKAYDSNYSKLLFVTATPESLSFINFDVHYEIHANCELSALNLQMIQIKSLDPKHISMTTAYCAKLKQAKNNTAMPYMVFVESKNMIDKMKETLSLEGFNCVSITSEDTIENNVALKSIIENQILPSVAQGRPIDFIFVTSTIVSGVSICANTLLGNNQYQPIIIADEPYKSDIAIYQQFLCRFRYNLNHVLIFTKLLENAKKELSLQDIEKKIKGYAKEFKSYINLSNENTAYLKEYLECYNAVTNINTGKLDKYAVYCNAHKEWNNRIYGHKESFIRELLKHFHVINNIYYSIYTPSEYKDLEFATIKDVAICDCLKRDYQKEQKEIKTQAAQTIIRNPEIIKTVFAADSCQSITQETREVLNKIREESNTLSLAYKIGGESKVIEHLTAICHSNDSQKIVSYSQFDIERQAALTELNLLPNITTVIEIALMDKNVRELKISAKNKRIIEDFKKTELYRLIKKIYDVTMNLEIIKERLATFENYNDIKNWSRTINSRRIVNAYMNNEIDLNKMKDLYIQGEELSIVLSSLKELQKSDFLLKSGIILNTLDLEYIVENLNNKMSLCVLTGKSLYTIKTIYNILNDIVPFDKNRNNEFISLNAYYNII